MIRFENVSKEYRSKKGGSTKALTDININLNNKGLIFIIGKSGSNLLDEEQDNCLLFEVYYNGNTIDPEDFYNMNINDLQ